MESIKFKDINLSTDMMNASQISSYTKEIIENHMTGYAANKNGTIQETASYVAKITEDFGGYLISDQCQVNGEYCSFIDALGKLSVNGKITLFDDVYLTGDSTVTLPSISNDLILDFNGHKIVETTQFNEFYGSGNIKYGALLHMVNDSGLSVYDGTIIQKIYGTDYEMFLERKSAFSTSKPYASTAIYFDSTGKLDIQNMNFYVDNSNVVKCPKYEDYPDSIVVFNAGGFYMANSTISSKCKLRTGGGVTIAQNNTNQYSAVLSDCNIIGVYCFNDYDTFLSSSPYNRNYRSSPFKVTGVDDVQVFGGRIVGKDTTAAVFVEATGGKITFKKDKNGNEPIVQYWRTDGTGTGICFAVENKYDSTKATMLNHSILSIDNIIAIYPDLLSSEHSSTKLNKMFEMSNTHDTYPSESSSCSSLIYINNGEFNSYSSYKKMYSNKTLSGSLVTMFIKGGIFNVSSEYDPVLSTYNYPISSFCVDGYECVQISSNPEKWQVIQKQ